MRCPFCEGDIEIPSESEPAFCISCGARQVDPEMEPEEDEWLRGDEG